MRFSCYLACVSLVIWHASIAQKYLCRSSTERGEHIYVRPAHRRKQAHGELFVLVQAVLAKQVPHAASSKAPSCLSTLGPKDMRRAQPTSHAWILARDLPLLTPMPPLFLAGTRVQGQHGDLIARTSVRCQRRSRRSRRWRLPHTR